MSVAQVTATATGFWIVFGYANIAISRKDGYIKWEHFQNIINTIRNSAFNTCVVHVGVDFSSKTPIKARFAITERHGSSLKDGTENLIRFLANDLGDMKALLSIEEPSLLIEGQTDAAL